MYQSIDDELREEIEKLKEEIAKLKSNERFCFESDGDSNNYLIPLEKRELFNKLLELDDEYEEFNNEFAEYRIDEIEGCYSFEKVEGIK